MEYTLWNMKTYEQKKMISICLFATMNVFIIMQDYINHGRNRG